MFMKASFILILVAQFFACVVSAQKIEYPYVHDLTGAVLECSEKKFSVQLVGNGIEKGRYLPNDDIGIRLFDRQGRLTEFRSHADTSGRYERTVLTYLEGGCLSEIKEYADKGYLESNSVFKCDKEGRVAEVIEYYFLYENKPISKTTYRYNKSGLITESHKKYGTPKRSAGKLTDSYEEDRYEHRYYEYDKNGFRIKWTIKREGIDPELVNLLSGGAEVTNDAQGRPVVEYGVNDEAAKAGKPKKLQKEMAYNEKGFLSRHVSYRAFGTEVSYYEYTYDEHGNWITKTELKSSNPATKGTPDNITIREIKYY
jgi:hypothetical protein